MKEERFYLGTAPGEFVFAFGERAGLSLEDDYEVIAITKHAIIEMIFAKAYEKSKKRTHKI